MAGIFIYDEEAFRSYPDIGVRPHLPPVAYGLKLNGCILMAVWSEGNLAVQREYTEPQLGIPERCLQERTSLRCAGVCWSIVHFVCVSFHLVAIFFEPFLDIDLAHSDGTPDPNRRYGVFCDELVGERPADTKQLAKVGYGQPFFGGYSARHMGFSYWPWHVCGRFLANENRVVASCDVHPVLFIMMLLIVTRQYLLEWCRFSENDAGVGLSSYAAYFLRAASYPP